MNLSVHQHDRIAYILTRSHVSSAFPPKLFGYSLKKTYAVVVSYGIRLPRHPLEHAPPASLFLSQRCQSATEPIRSQFQPQTNQAQKTQGPLLRTPGSHAQSVGFRHEDPPRRSAASLSNPAYMATNTQLSSFSNHKSSTFR